MKLSKLVYLCVKNTIFYNDASFDYDSFKEGLYDNDFDYGSNINNCFLCINEAVARLNDMNRIPYKICKKTANCKGIIDLNGEQKQIYGGREDIYVKEIMSVGQINQEFVPYVEMGNNIIKIDSTRPKTYYIEFKEDIKHFDRSDYSYIVDETNVGAQKVYTTSTDIDLREYGINDSMCNYIMEYVMGRLLEDVSPELANMHITRAEQYFANIRPVRSAFLQRKVKSTYKIGE